MICTHNESDILELVNKNLNVKDTEKRQFGEVFTPIEFVNKMLDEMNKYYPNIFKNPNLTWYDPAAGMGNFHIALFYKLNEGLKKIIHNEHDRKKHIIENMLYFGELNKKNCDMIRKIFNVNNEYKLNLYEGDTLSIDLEKIFNTKRFDMIIGNPPYNKLLTRTGANPLYNEFIEYYIEKCDMLSFVVPSRWFCGGKGLDKFRRMMLNRQDIVYIKHIDNASEVFGSDVNIEGGINYFLKNSMYNNKCKYNDVFITLNKYDVLVDSKYYNIIDKLTQYESLTTLYLGRYFGIDTNDKRLTNNNNKDHIKCYVSQHKGFNKFINKNEISRDYNFMKVITTESNGKYKCFGNTFIGNKSEVHSGSYISFKVNTQTEAESLLSYMKCRLPNFMLSLRKISQHINESTCKWIPIPTLDKIWNNNEVYKYFELTPNEIDLIKNTEILGYKN